MPSSAGETLTNGSLIQSRLLWIVRHGQRVDNVEPKWRANGAFPRGQWDDPPLSTRGLLQASEVGVALAAEPIHWVFCSPFTRCLQTAQQIVNRVRQNAVQLAIPSVCIEPGLAESLNACQSPPGFPDTNEILQSFPDLCVNANFRPFITADLLPADERTNFCCFRRVIATLRHILKTFSGNVLIVSHGSPITACHFALSGQLNYPGQCTISKYRIPEYKTTTVVDGHSHWTERWKCQRRKAMPLPPMGQSVVVLEVEGAEKRTDGEGKSGEMQMGRDTLLWLDEVLEGMSATVNLCTDLNAECVTLADVSHLSERKGLHDALILRSLTAEATEKS